MPRAGNCAVVEQKLAPVVSGTGTVLRFRICLVKVGTAVASAVLNPPNAGETNADKRG